MDDEKKEFKPFVSFIGLVSVLSLYGILIGLTVAIWTGILGIKIAGTCALLAGFTYPFLKSEGYYG